MELIAILLAAVGLWLPGLDGPDQPNAVRTCFSTELWSAEDRDRPCVQIVRVEEDGSFQAVVGTASGGGQTTVSVGNPND